MNEALAVASVFFVLLRHEKEYNMDMDITCNLFYTY